MIRLGDGTEESHNRMLKAIGELWCYTGEMFLPSVYENIVDVAALKESWEDKVNAVLTEASLIPPSGSGGAVFMQTGGKTGTHTEHLGYILTDLQYLQRTYPGAEW